jgi:hypothetical protein
LQKSEGKKRNLRVLKLQNDLLLLKLQNDLLLLTRLRSGRLAGTQR